MVKRIDPDDRDAFKVRVEGIPAIAYVTYYNSGDSGAPATFDRKTADLVDPGEPPTPEEVEWELYDRKGYEADWLFQMADEEDITDQVLNWIKWLRQPEVEG